MKVTKIFMAGMPGSGKTAYIGSTWNLIEESSMPTKLHKKVGSVPENYKKLDEISRQLLTYNDIKRTKEDENIELKISLYDEKQNEIFLDVPDSAGEVFRDLVADRRIKKEIVERLRESNCILFFVYYKNMSKEERIPLSSKKELEDDIKECTNLENQQASGDNFSGTDIEKLREANQSEVVELLQAILELLCENTEPIKIRFVMSAWDMVEKEYGNKISPKEFMKEMFPFLYQFIMANAERMDSEFWGISALGGDLNNPDDVQRLQKEEYNAIKVLAPDGYQSNDLTALLCGIGE